MPICSVLELGAGLFSTPTFLNRRVFPKLERIVSVEDDPNWAAQVQQANGDNRLTVIKNLPAIDSKFDLLFVDNSQSEFVRKDTIRKVVQESEGSIVVVHDAEYQEYWSEVVHFEKFLRIETYEKWTAIGHNRGRFKIPDISGIITSHLDLAPTDIDGWLKVFNS